MTKLKVEQSTDFVEKMRAQMTAEEAAFDRELEDVILAGKRALLRLRMQKAVETPGMKTHLFKRIRRQIARAMTLRRQREIARGITKSQSRRMKRRTGTRTRSQSRGSGSAAWAELSERWLAHSVQ